jgi:hypothetical protein
LAAFAHPAISSVRFDLAAEAKNIAARIAGVIGQEAGLETVAGGAIVEVVARLSTAGPAGSDPRA